MESVATAKKETANIPDYLIYEWVGDIPVYYRNYQKVLSGELKLSDVVGYGELQWVYVNILGNYLKDALGKDWWVLIGEGGLHLEKNRNSSLDLAIYPRSAINLQNLQIKYLDHPPEVIIEIDTKADLEIMLKMDYINAKTQQLLDFGVQQLVWLFTNTRKVLVARPGQAWLTVNWSDEIEVLGHAFKIEEVIAAAG